MVNAFQWLALIATIWIIRELVMIFLTWRKVRKLKQVIRVERTRSQFAEARNGLMHLAVNKQIDPKSATFQALYRIDTVFMRLPDRYPQLSASLRDAILSNDDQPNEQLLAEKKNWNEAIRENILVTSRAMDRLIIDYSLLFWIGSEIAKRPWLAKPMVMAAYNLKCWIERWIERMMEKRDPDVWEIRRAQRVMQSIATA